MKTLVVEDDFTSRVLLQEILQEFGTVHVAVNGREAMAAVSAALEAGTPYDLICLDILMPEMDGQQTLEAIRRLEPDRGVPPAREAKIFMTTAVSSLKEVSKAYSRLCDAYCLKPIDKGRLLEALREHGLVA